MPGCAVKASSSARPAGHTATGRAPSIPRPCRPEGSSRSTPGDFARWRSTAVSTGCPRNARLRGGGIPCRTASCSPSRGVASLRTGRSFGTRRRPFPPGRTRPPPRRVLHLRTGGQAFPRGGHGRLRLRPAPRAGGPLPGALRRRDARPVGREVPRPGRAGEAGPLLFRQRPGGIRGPQRPSAPRDAAPGLTARSRRPSEGWGSGYRTLIVLYFAIRTSPGFAPLNLETCRASAKNTGTFCDPFALLWRTASRAASSTTSSGTSLSGARRIRTWLPGIPWVCSHRSSGAESSFTIRSFPTLFFPMRSVYPRKETSSTWGGTAFAAAFAGFFFACFPGGDEGEGLGCGFRRFFLRLFPGGERGGQLLADGQEVFPGRCPRKLRLERLEVVDRLGHLPLPLPHDLRRPFRLPVQGKVAGHVLHGGFRRVEGNPAELGYPLAHRGQVRLQRLAVPSPLEAFLQPFLVAAHVLELVALFFQKGGQAGFDLLPEDGILEVLRGFPVEEVRRLVGRRRGGKIDEPRLRAGEREDPLLPRGQGADPRGEVVLLVPADQPPHRFEQVAGALLPAAGRLVGQFLPQPGNFPLEDARQPLPSHRPDPLRVGRGDLGEENPFGLGERPVRNARDDLPDPALLGGDRPKRFEDEAVGSHVDQVGMPTVQLREKGRPVVLRVGPQGEKLHPDQPVEGNDGDPGKAHPGQVAPKVLAETRGGGRVGDAPRGEVDATEIRMGGNKEARLLPAGPHRQDHLPVPGLGNLGDERSPQAIGQLHHDPFQEERIHRDGIVLPSRKGRGTPLGTTPHGR